MHDLCLQQKDPRYIVEKDGNGRYTLTIKEVREEDGGDWVARVTDSMASKTYAIVVGESISSPIPHSSLLQSRASASSCR